MLKETANAIKKLDVEVETIVKIQSGEAPSPPPMSKESEKANLPGEPIIKIVEVCVLSLLFLVKVTSWGQGNLMLHE